MRQTVAVRPHVPFEHALHGASGYPAAPFIRYTTLATRHQNQEQAVRNVLLEPDFLIRYRKRHRKEHRPQSPPSFLEHRPALRWAGILQKTAASYSRTVCTVRPDESYHS